MHFPDLKIHELLEPPCARRPRARQVAAVWLFAILLAQLFAGSARGELTPGTPAPELPRNEPWLGLAGLPPTMASLRGKVVLVDFWDYTCINCIRTFPHLKEWHRRYAADGLVIIGVHKAEFRFANKPANVAAAYKRFLLPYPSIVDVNDEAWKVYDSNSWPNSFLIDRQGIIRSVHSGEGHYGTFEREIQRLLAEGRPQISFLSDPIAPDRDLFDPKTCGPMSPEIYIGYKRGDLWGGHIANSEGYEQDAVVAYHDQGRRVVRGFFVNGLWRDREDGLESASGSKGPRADRAAGAPGGAKPYLGITCRGADVYMVATMADRPVTLIVTRDGRPLPPENRGKDVHVNARGQTAVTLDAPRMYYVVTRQDADAHELRLYPESNGALICSFTFGNQCLSDFDRL